MTLTVGMLRSLFKHLEAFRSLYEAENIDVIHGPDGVSYSLHDIEYLYAARAYLSPRQRQSIELFLVQNIREKDVARIMGVSESNPVASYAAHGLKRILEMITEGKLPRFQTEDTGDHHGPAPLRRAPATGRRGDGTHPQGPGGGDLDVGEIGRPDPVERDGPQAPGGLQRGRSAGRGRATWHVPPGVEFHLPAFEQRGGESPPSSRRPPHWTVRSAFPSERIRG